MVDQHDTPDVVGAEPDDEMELIYARTGRTRSWATAALCLVAAASVGFAAGVRLQKAQATPAATSATGTAGSRRRGGGTATLGGAGIAGRALTIGTVKLIDGTNLYVTDSTGNVVKVAAATASVSKVDPGALTDIRPGDTLVVVGPSGADGTVNARDIRDNGPGGSGLGASGGG